MKRARVVRAEGTSAVADGVLGRWFTAAFRGESPVTVARFREMFCADPGRGATRRCCEAIAGWDAALAGNAIRAPTLVIAGADDSSTPPERRRVDRRGDRRRAARGPARTPRISPTSSSPTGFTRALLGAHAGPAGTEAHERPATRQGMKVRREVLGDEHVDAAIAADDAVHGGVPGPDHPLRVG